MHKLSWSQWNNSKEQLCIIFTVWDTELLYSCKTFYQNWYLQCLSLHSNLQKQWMKNDFLYMLWSVWVSNDAFWTDKCFCNLSVLCKSRAWVICEYLLHDISEWCFSILWDERAAFKACVQDSLHATEILTVCQAVEMHFQL